MENLKLFLRLNLKLENTEFRTTPFAHQQILLSLPEKNLKDLPFIQPDFLKYKKIQSYQSIAGGDINEAWRVVTTDGIYFLKENRQPPVSEFLAIEKRGLEILANTETIKIPETFVAGNLNGTAYLIMEYLPTVLPNKLGWERMGQQLAALHRTTQEQFGLDHNNFIGSLPQSNNPYSNWAEFYVKERLEPQVKLAADRRLLNVIDLKQFKKLYQEIPAICPEEPPALTHGDLWSGNFLMTKNQIPVLIDPAVSYAHREMDLAMSHLFGGFDPIFYNAYESVFPTAYGFLDRMEIYQLYYLLVHLNLFGSGYLGKVRNIVRQFI